MRAVAKILRARASEQSSHFCEQFEHRPNFASTFKLDGTIRYPLFCFVMRANRVPEFLRYFPFDLAFTKRSLTGHREQRIDMLLIQVTV